MNSVSFRNDNDNGVGIEWIRDMGTLKCDHVCGSLKSIYVTFVSVPI